MSPSSMILRVKTRGTVPTPTPPPPSEEPFTADVWVAKTGSNSNNGLSETDQGGGVGPKLTIAGASGGLSVLSGGQRLAIKAGTYNESIDTNSIAIPSGTSWDDATEIIAYPGDTVVISDTSPVNITGAQGEVKYVIFDGLDIFNSSGINDVFSINGPVNHLRIIRCKIHGSLGSQSGLNMQFGATGPRGNHEIIDCEIYENGDGSSGGGSGTTGHGIYCTVSDCLFQGNHIHNNGHYSIQFFTSLPNPHPTNCTFIRNLVHTNRQGIISGNGGGPRVFGSGHLFHSNIIYDEQTGTAWDGSGNFYNNTIHECDVGMDFRSSGEAKNNIIYQCSDPVVHTGSMTFDQNMCNVADTGIEFVDDPEFVSAAARNYLLQSTSPARDTGLTIALVAVDFNNLARPQGSAYCIGALEFV